MHYISESPCSGWPISSSSNPLTIDYSSDFINPLTMSSESPSLEDSVGLTRTCNGEGCEQAIDMKGEVSEGTTLESLGTPVSNATEFYCLGVSEPPDTTAA